MGPESRLTQKIMKRLKALGAYVVKIHGSQYGRAGVPDLVVCWKGKSIWIEIKTKVGKVSNIQYHELDKIRSAGGVAVVAYDVGDAEMALSTALLQEMHHADRTG